MKKRLIRPLLKFEIEEAQAKSRSAAEAARTLGVAPQTYKKYAQLYGIYENLLNQRGIGVDKGFSFTKPHVYKLKDIFANKHTSYPLQRLKWRMIKRGLVENECEMCGFEEARLTDGKKPLLMTFRNKEGDYSPSNLIILCYNCMFLTRDAPSVVNRATIKRSLERPGSISQHRDPYLDPDHVGLEPDDDLSDEDIAELKREIDRELGR